MKNDVVETIVGAVVITLAVVFFIFAYKTAGIGTASGGYTINAVFGSVDGISVGTDVRISGVKVGSVTEQKLDPKTFQATLVLAIAPEIRLPEDSSAKITSEGLLGGNYVSVDPGGADTILAAGDTIEYTQGAIDLMSLIGQAVFGGNK
ncbi:Phospholipid ABC transporter substrate-binding protein MlaD [hydrothermal vent metagenome]|uniref:Phospholipid ABC transporter substrate-binding protein MlaD n=1 Tax=hydrothermal vent metagenome TaxID=652676 RepID=A0A3B0TPS3_9ZZZZ